MQIIYQIEEIQKVAEAITSACKGNGVIALNGEMGAGKTTLITAMCKIFQVGEMVSSPTYTIANEYHGVWCNEPITIYHMDWFRLKNAEAIIDAGMIDLFETPNALCIVEWSSIAANLLPSNCLNYVIEIINENKRSITQLS